MVESCEITVVSAAILYPVVCINYVMNKAMEKGGTENYQIR